MTNLTRCCVCGFFIFIYWCSTVSAQVVDIPDPNLEKAIREALALPDESPLTQQEMLQLTRLEAKEKQIENLTGLEHATNLTDLRFARNEISELTPLIQLNHLRLLSIWGNPISDLSPLANLTRLKSLDLGGCQVSDITPLANLTQLESLHLHINRIEDIASLANLTQLVDLWLQSNQITDITPLIGLKNLKELYLADNPFHDFSPLLELEGVELDIEISEGFNVVVEIPDPSLRQLIREVLSLPEAAPLAHTATDATIDDTERRWGPWNYQPNGAGIRNQYKISPIIPQSNRRY